MSFPALATRTTNKKGLRLTMTVNRKPFLIILRVWSDHRVTISEWTLSGRQASGAAMPIGACADDRP